MKRAATDLADVCAQHVAQQLDMLGMIAGAAGKYRQQLVQQGFDPGVAMMLAAQWASGMQSTIGGGR